MNKSSEVRSLKDLKHIDSILYNMKSEDLHLSFHKKNRFQLIILTTCKQNCGTREQLDVHSDQNKDNIHKKTFIIKA